MAEKTVLITQQLLKPIKVTKWKVSSGNSISIGGVILLYDFEGATAAEQRKLKSTRAGTVHELIAPEGAIIRPGQPLLKLKACIHPTVMKDMCAECGADLRMEETLMTASVPMVHSIPDLKVSEELAQKLGRADGERLLRDRKLVLLVDLDQTLIHTTNDNIPVNIKDVYHFQLYGPNSPWYHTRLRPGTHQFLSNVSPFFELHICTFGARNYAHMITMFLDGDQRFFSNRILSRDECFDPTSKKANLKALFPCGDNMVCIIDDREDVWNHASNLIHVKPYHFFQHTGDINAPPGLDKHEQDDKEGFDLTKIKRKPIKPNGKNVNNGEKNGVANKEKSSQKNDGKEIGKKECTDEKNEEKIKLAEIEENVEKMDVSEGDENVKTDSSENGVSKIQQNVKEQENADQLSKDLEEKKEQNDVCERDNKVSVIKINTEKTLHDRDSKDTKELSDKDNEKCDEGQKVVVEEKSEKENSCQRNTDNKSDPPNDNTNNREESEDIKKINETGNQEMVDVEGETKEESLENEIEPIKKSDNVKGNTTSSEEIKLNEPEIKSEEIKTTNIESTKKLADMVDLKKSDDMIEIEDPDDYLLYLEEILRRIHKTFYEEYDRMESGVVPDLKRVIPDVRSKILQGTKLVFSGLVPTHVKLQQSKAYQVARSLGAVVTQDLDAETTHLVAVRPGTAKVNAGRRKKNLKIVTPDWLWACAERWEHVDEAIFPLNSKGSKNRHPPPHCSSPEHVAGYPVHETPGVRKRTPSGRFMDTINPLMSFSSDDIADMDKEVEDILDDESDESEDDSQKQPDPMEQPLPLKQPPIAIEEESSSSSEESLTGEFPRGFKRTRDKRKLESLNNLEEDDQIESSLDEFPSAKFRRGEQLDSDLDIGQESNSEGSAEAPDEVDDGEWNMMGAALEREFLSNN